ncbi:MAG: hypothetical protein GYA17_05995 [Chloroflexi bacterium]|nr:hypothetical protein [Chloroflexota bacterium]
MAKYFIIVSCGTAITSTTVAARLKTLLVNKGYDCETRAIRAPDAIQKVDQLKPDCIVFTGAPPKGLPCPVFPGVAFLSGIGKEKAMEDIIQVLEKPHWAGKVRLG